jgi:putative membrane protein
LAVAVVGGFVVGAVTAQRVDWLRRLFTPRAEMREEVFARARAAFYDNRVHHTAGGAGVLLYVSLFERMAAVIADQAVIDACGQQQIDAFCGEFTKRLHESAPTDALCATIQSVGDCLAGRLPRAADDVNELADALVVIE